MEENTKTLSTFVVLENLECKVFFVNPGVITGLNRAGKE